MDAAFWYSGSSHGGWTPSSPGSLSDSSYLDNISSGDNRGDVASPVSLQSFLNLEDTRRLVTLQELLADFLGHASRPIFRPLDGDKFQRLAAEICGHTFFKEWLLAKASGSFQLQLPVELNHPLFVDAMVDYIFTKYPKNGRLLEIEARDRNQGEAKRGFPIAKLCNCILLKEVSEVPCPADLMNDLRDSLNGFNHAWREATLWRLLKWLLSSRFAMETLIIVSFRGPVDQYQQYIKFLQEFDTYMSSVESINKLLILPPPGELLVLPTLRTLKVDLSEMRESLSEDLESLVHLFFRFRPALRPWESAKTFEQIRQARFREPILTYAYLRHLGTSSWLTHARIEDGFHLLSTSGGLVRSILATIPDGHRRVVAMTLALVHRAARPITSAEVAIALAVYASGADYNTTMDRNAVLDLDFDVHTSLAGLVYEQRGCLHILDSSLSDLLDQKAPDPDIPWLYSGGHSDMEIGKICMNYIRAYSETFEVERLGMEALGGADQWPFLGYAIRFWHYHLQSAESAGAPVPEIDSPFWHWGTIKSWIDLWPQMHRWEEPLCETDETSTSGLAELAHSYKVTMTKALELLLHTCRVMSSLGGNKRLAGTWTKWQLGDPSTAQEALDEMQKDPADLTKILKALPLSPSRTFIMFSENQELVKENLEYILNVAIKQGTVEILEHCWYLVPTDEKFISELPWRDCARIGAFGCLQRLAKSWPQIEETQNMLGPVILSEAVTNGHLEVVKLLLECPFKHDPTGDGEILDDAVSAASERGYKDILAILLERRPELLQPSAPKALLKATKSCFTGIVKALLDHNGVDYSDSLMEAVSSQHVPMEQLFPDAQKRVTQHRAGSIVREPDTVGVDAAQALDPEISRSDFSLKKALRLAAETSTGEIFTLLLLADDTNDNSELKQEMFYLATLARNIDVIRVLVSLRGIDLDKPDEFGQTAVHHAALYDREDIVRVLIEHGADIRTRDDYGDSPLDDAARYGAAKTIQLLLEKLGQSDISFLNTAFLGAATGNEGQIVTRLLDSGADKNHQNEREQTALHVAASRGLTEIVRILLLRQATVDIQNRYSETPLVEAVVNSQPDIVELLLGAGADINVRDRSDSSVLEMAVRQCDSEMTQLLLNRGAYVDLDRLQARNGVLDHLVRSNYLDMVDIMMPYVQDPVAKVRAARLALRNDSIPMLELLLNSGTDQNAWRKQSQFGTPFEECAYYGNLKMAQYLYSRSEATALNETDGLFHSPLIASVSRFEHSTQYLEEPGHAEQRVKYATRRQKRQIAMFDFLMTSGANVNATGGIFWHVLTASAAIGSKELMSHVFRKTGCSLHVADPEGRTLAHMASIFPNNSKAKLEFIANEKDGKDLLKKADNFGRQPLHLASGNTSVEIVKFILSTIGYDQINARDEDGWTPLHWAHRQDDARVRMLLIEKNADQDAKTQDGMTPSGVAALCKDQDSRPADPRTAWCDSCFMRIGGKGYECQDCVEFHLCFKCYRTGRSLHYDGGHSFLSM